MDFKKLLKIFEAPDSGATGASAMASRSKPGITPNANDTIDQWQGNQPIIHSVGSETPAGAMADPDVYKSAPKAQMKPFGDVDAFVQAGMPKSSVASIMKTKPAGTSPVSPTALPRKPDSGAPAVGGTNVVSGSGQAIKTGSGGTLRTRSADEFGSSPQDYYKKMMRPGQMEESDESLEEEAVSKQQQKFMGMVHAMKKGEKVKGASPELKKAAKSMSKKDAKDFASTKHKGLPNQVAESVELFDEKQETLKHIANRFKYETKMFMQSGHMDDDLYYALYDYYRDKGDMPIKVATTNPHAWVEERFYQDMGSGMSESTHDLTDLARLAGLSEAAELNECGDMDMEQSPHSSMNISTNMSSNGDKNVTVSAEGDQAEALIDMLKLAGMKHDHISHHEEEPVAIITSDDDEILDENGMRLFHKAHSENGIYMAKVYKDTEWGEFVVKFFKMGKPLPSNTWYHTDDIEDAAATAERELAYMEQHDKSEEGLEEEYANVPKKKYQSINAITRQGNDLNRQKKQYAGKPKLGDNPMAESLLQLDAHLEEMLESIKIKEAGSVLDAEKPYRDPNTGKMITPPKGATMPPADSEFPPGDPRNSIPAIPRKSTKPAMTAPKAPAAPKAPSRPSMPIGIGDAEPDDGILNLPPKQRGGK